MHVGSGPALLLIHGIGNSLEAWASQIEDLSRDYTVIAPDLLGHGRSDKPRADYSVAAYANGMRDLISVLGVDRVTIVGHSLGGGVATQFAYQFPERCERLVLVSAGGVSKAVHPMLRALTAPMAEYAMACLQLPGARPVAKAWFELLRAAGNDLHRDTPDVMLMFDALRDSFSRKAFLRTLGAVVDLQGQVVTMLDRCYLTQGMPTLLVWASAMPSTLQHCLLAHSRSRQPLGTFDAVRPFRTHGSRALNAALRDPGLHRAAPSSSDQWRTIRARVGHRSSRFVAAAAAPCKRPATSRMRLLVLAP